MSHNELSDNALSLMASGLAENQSLTELFITHNDLSLPSGVKFINSLANKPQLKSLALNSCRLSSALLEKLVSDMKDSD